MPHYHVNRHMQKIDLEFSSNKLQHETQLFLETTLERDPKRFEKLQKANKLWIDFRLNSDKPVQIEDLIKAKGGKRTRIQSLESKKRRKSA